MKRNKPTKAKKAAKTKKNEPIALHEVDAADLTMAAISACGKLLKDRQMVASSVSAGFMLDPFKPVGSRTGYQVFVKLVRFSEAKLIANPESGGLPDEW